MEQVLVLASIVLGVAIAFELEHLSTVMRAKNVKWHWAQPLFALFVLLTIIAFWWSAVSWTTRPEADETISFARFLPMMLQMVLLALLAAAAFPATIPEDGLDLADYYQESRTYQWTLFALYFLIIHIGYVFRTAQEAESIADMAATVPDTLVLLVVVLMIFARKWWQVGLGFAVLSIVPIAWSLSLTLG